MQSLFLQVQMLLAGLGAVLPLVPQKSRARVGEVLELVGAALRLGEAVSSELDDLAVKLRAVRLDIERLVESGRPLTGDDFDTAFQRVRGASDAFRAALAAAESQEAG
jgi:hypothetical protein